MMTFAHPEDPILFSVELITATEAGQLITEQANLCGYQFLADNRRRNTWHTSRIPFTRRKRRILYDRRVIEGVIPWIKGIFGTPAEPIPSSIESSAGMWTAFAVGSGASAGVRVIGASDELMSVDDAERFALKMLEEVKVARVLH